MDNGIKMVQVPGVCENPLSDEKQIIAHLQNKVESLLQDNMAITEKLLKAQNTNKKLDRELNEANIKWHYETTRYDELIERILKSRGIE